MRAVRISLYLLAAFSLLAVEKDSFRARPAGKYAAHQKQSDVTVGVKPYHTERDMKEAFGKAKPFKHGFLPVLVVITNQSDDPMGLEDLKVRFITGDRQGLEPIPAEDLAYFQPKGHKPKDPPPYVPRVPGVWRRGAKKGPLAQWQIQEREFKAPVLSPRSSVSGFFYYRTGVEPDPIPGSSIYLAGVRNLKTGQELFYFEISLDPYRGKK